jgi:hypothetical protein
MFFYLIVGLVFAQDRATEYKKRTEIDFEALDISGEMIKPTEIDFEALDISGEMIKPQGSVIIERKKAEFNPLIRIRTDFNQEMSDSIREIK